ncbi:MAG TPA: hypothetical protein VGM53_21315 [Streptosporangiaceae bacterium]|jgi:hypothetical protein
MRKLLVLGVAAATTLLSAAATATPVLASTHKPLTTSCTDDGSGFVSVTAKGTNFYVGTPNSITSGSAATLKPTQNSTTRWTACVASSGSVQLVQKRGTHWYALTSRATAVGQDVSAETVSNNGTTGTAFASQLWIVVGSSTVTLQNQSTKLYLRVRNSGPMMYQTVTTGLTSETWTLS